MYALEYAVLLWRGYLVFMFVIGFQGEWWEFIIDHVGFYVMDWFYYQKPQKLTADNNCLKSWISSNPFLTLDEIVYEKPFN